jgi:hypothetical protein
VKVFTGTKLQKKKRGGGRKKERERGHERGEKKKRKGEERKKKESRTPLSKAEKHRGRGVNSTMHSTFSSPSPSSSPQRASTEGKKRNRDHQPAWPSFSLSPEAVTTGCAQKLQYRCLHPSQLPERERKKTQKTGQRRRKKKGIKRRKNEKP